jgi:hypothetical protein
MTHSVKVRIVKRPTGTLDGMALKRYVPGEVYDLSPGVADFLILEGFARPEMRSGTRSRVRVKKKPDRRR